MVSEAKNEGSLVPPHPLFTKGNERSNIKVMNICSDNHEEIVYEGRHCPLCQANSEIKDWTSELEKAREEIDELLKIKTNPPQ